MSGEREAGGSSRATERAPTRIVVLVGHGAPPVGYPREAVARLKALEQQRRRIGGAVSDEERQLDARIRSFPRTAGNDPYRAGLEALVAALARALPDARVVPAFNEFCAPSLEDAVLGAIAAGARRIDVVPSMLTPGGVHSEEEIPETLAALSNAHPEVEIVYRWPFDLDRVARILAEQLVDQPADGFAD